MARARSLTSEQYKQIGTLYAGGMSHREIAERVGCHRNTVSTFVNDPNYQIDRKGLRERVKNMAARRLVKTIDMAYGVTEDQLKAGDAYGAKAATGALKDLDQLHSVACDDDRQAGVATPQLAPQETTVLIQAILGYIDRRDQIPA